jgi:hypothetical protein
LPNARLTLIEGCRVTPSTALTSKPVVGPSGADLTRSCVARPDKVLLHEICTVEMRRSHSKPERGSRATRWAAAVGLWFCVPAAHAQQVVQGVVDGLVDPVVAYQASLLLEGQEGVQMARFDVHTRNMLLRVTPTCTLDRGALNILLAPMGLHARCVQRRATMPQPFRHIDPATCTNLPQQTR